MSKSVFSMFVVVGGALFLLLNSLFIIDQRQAAIQFQLGEIVKSDFEPGLHLKIPFINNIKKYDARILTLDAKPERYLTGEKKNLIVDSFVKWRILDVAKFYTATGGDEFVARSRLSQIIKDGLRGEFGKRTIQEVISGERAEIMNILTKNANDQVTDLGIEVIDVRLKRIDLPPKINESVYQRMEAERSRVAKELRSQGAEVAEKIRAEADREKTEILADAYKEAEKIRGIGDAKATEIYASAYNQDNEFYSFYRSLNAYKSSFSSPSDVLVVDPKSDFFKYFNGAETKK